MITLIDSMSFVAAVLGIAFVAWLIRSIAESDPDPLLLNLTFFAFAGQCIHTAELIRGGKQEAAILIVLLAPGVLLLLLQLFTIRAQEERTLEHYIYLLEENKIGNLSSDQIERWAAVLLRITGVDFYPEFYMRMFPGLGGGPRHKRRKQAVSILPTTQFKYGGDGITAVALIVPQKTRQVLWRLYVIICILSWCVFLSSILIATRHP